MQRSSPIAHLLSTAFGIVVLWYAASYLPLSYLGTISSTGGWFPVVSLVHNAYLSWRLDHITALILNLLGATHINDAVPVQLALLYCGTILCLRQLGGRALRGALSGPIAGLGIVLAVFFLVGRDPVTLGALAWGPFLAVLLTGAMGVTRAGAARSAGPLWLFLLFTSVEHSRSANQAALVTAIAAASFSAYLERRTAESSGTRETVPVWVVLVVLIPALCGGVWAPIAPYPDYPPLARVASFDGIASLPRPLVGVDFPTRVIDRAELRTLLAPVAAPLFLGALITALLAYRAGSRALQTVIVCGGIIIGCVCLDVYGSEALASISPIASGARLVPSGAFICWPPIVLALGTWLISVALASAGLSPASIPWLLSVVIGGVLAQHSQGQVSPTPERLQISLSVLNGSANEEVVVSPSLNVIRAFNQSLPSLTARMNDFREAAALEAQSLKSISPSIRTTPSGGERNMPVKMIDGKLSSRWSPTVGSQSGTESIEVDFPSPFVLKGIVLSTGTFATDFPRGLSISTIDCTTRSEVKSLTTGEWQGPLKFTPRGFPYFGGQDEVRVLFDAPEQVSCIRINQLETAPFDWSVAELEILQ